MERPTSSPPPAHSDRAAALASHHVGAQSESSSGIVGGRSSVDVEMVSRLGISAGTMGLDRDQQSGRERAEAGMPEGRQSVWPVVGGSESGVGGDGASAQRSEEADEQVEQSTARERRGTI